MRRFLLLMLPVVLLTSRNGFADELVIENARIRAIVGTDACWKSLVDKQSGKELLAKGRKIGFAVANVDGKARTSNSATMAGDKLVVGLDGGQTKLTYVVSRAEDWITFHLQSISGPRPTNLTLIRAEVTLTEHVGTRLDAGWNRDYAVCLMATSLQAQGHAARRKSSVELAVTTQDAPGPKLEGAGAALIGSPPVELPKLLWRLAEAYGLPKNGQDGVPSNQLPVARQSYWFISVTEDNVDRVIDVCRRSGIRQVMMSSGSWCKDVGHYTFRANNYPHGLAGLKQVVAKMHDHGILVGMHCFASKVSKTDAFVTPLPDRRFWVDMSAKLARDVGPRDAEIRMADDLSQWPGSSACKQKSWEGSVEKHREVILDNEIIRYQSIGPEGKWDTMLGCQRCAWGTAAAGHKAGTAGRHYGVDGCINGYIIDQETDLLNETTDRLAEIFNTCDFDMVYFDGGEDVARTRFIYYVSKFQAVAMSKFKRRPLIHMGTIFTHNLWNSFTRSGTVDTYLNTLHGKIIAGASIEKWPTVRDHINHSVRYMLSVRDDMVPGELGWFGIWPKGEHTDGLQLDEAEYLMAKSLAYDAPISLETGFAQMDSHPLTPGILEIVGAYEQLRMNGTVAESTRRKLQELNKDFLLIPGEAPEFVEVQAVLEVAGGHDLRAWVGPYAGGAAASLWQYLGKEGTLTIASDKVQAVDIKGQPLNLTTSSGKTAVPIDHRRTLVRFAGMTPADVSSLLATARFEPRQPVTLWIEAESFTRIEGRMAKGSDAAVLDPEAMGDFVVGTGLPRAVGEPDGSCEYRVTIPHAGLWTVWARVRYPRGGDMSFSIDLPTANGQVNRQVLGNCGRAGAGWHWTGRGGGVTTPPPGLPIRMKLGPGEYVLRVHPREGYGKVQINPRLDVLCLTEDTTYVPTDADRKAAANK